MFLYLKILLMALCLWLAPSLAVAQEGTFYDVTWLECHDGDTCWMLIPYLPEPFTKIKVRLSDIDAPEMRGKCEQERQLAIQARLTVIRWLSEARRIDLLHVTPDAFFRIDAVVMVDNMSVNALLVQSHLAVPSQGTRTQDWCLPLEEIFPDYHEGRMYDPRDVS